MSQEQQEWQKLGKSLYDYLPEGQRDLHFIDLQNQLENRSWLRRINWRWLLWVLFFVGTSAGILLAWIFQHETPRLVDELQDSSIARLNSSRLKSSVDLESDLSVANLPKTTFPLGTTTTLDSSTALRVIPDLLIQGQPGQERQSPPKQPSIEAENPASSDTTSLMPVMATLVQQQLKAIDLLQTEMVVLPETSRSVELANPNHPVSGTVDQVEKIRKHHWEIDGGFATHHHTIATSATTEQAISGGFYFGASYWRSIHPLWQIGIRLGYRHHNHMLGGNANNWISHRLETTVLGPNSGSPIAFSYFQRYPRLKIWTIGLSAQHRLGRNFRLKGGIQYGFLSGETPSNIDQSNSLSTPFSDYSPSIIRRHNLAAELAINLRLRPRLRMELTAHIGLSDIGINNILHNEIRETTDGLKLGFNYAF
ncbi:MAG: hypothetical protein AAF433_16430 [Bacteroidota bacterium]